MSQVLSARLPAVGANGTTTQELGAVPTNVEEYQIGRVELVPIANRSADTAPNFATVNVRRVRAGSATVIAHLDLTVALTAETPVQIPFNTGFSTDAAVFQADDVVDVTVSQSGTGGGAIADGNEVQVELV
jgi:hypothetical protein